MFGNISYEQYPDEKAYTLKYSSGRNIVEYNIYKLDKPSLLRNFTDVPEDIELDNLAMYGQNITRYTDDIEQINKLIQYSHQKFDDDQTTPYLLYTHNPQLLSFLNNLNANLISESIGTSGTYYGLILVNKNENKI